MVVVHVAVRRTRRAITSNSQTSTWIWSTGRCRDCAARKTNWCAKKSSPTEPSSEPHSTQTSCMTPLALRQSISSGRSKVGFRQFVS